MFKGEKMIPSLKKHANISAGIALVSLAGLSALRSYGFIQGNIWDTGNIPAIIVFSVFGVSYITALCLYAKAKEYSGIIGFLLVFPNILGLLILVLLPDRTKQSPANS
jgi:hypothetical protein